ncbi:unnamed protein product [Closterium sp. NIES-54]
MCGEAAGEGRVHGGGEERERGDSEQAQRAERAGRGARGGEEGGVPVAARRRHHRRHAVHGWRCAHVRPAHRAAVVDAMAGRVRGAANCLPPADRSRDAAATTANGWKVGRRIDGDAHVAAREQSTRLGSAVAAVLASRGGCSGAVQKVGRAEVRPYVRAPMAQPMPFSWQIRTPQISDLGLIWLDGIGGDARHLLLEDKETGDVLFPLVTLTSRFQRGHSRKLSSLAYRMVVLPDWPMARAGEGSRKRKQRGEAEGGPQRKAIAVGGEVTRRGGDEGCGSGKGRGGFEGDGDQEEKDGEGVSGDIEGKGRQACGSSRGEEAGGAGGSAGEVRLQAAGAEGNAVGRSGGETFGAHGKEEGRGAGAEEREEEMEEEEEEGRERGGGGAYDAVADREELERLRAFGDICWLDSFKAPPNVLHQLAQQVGDMGGEVSLVPLPVVYNSMARRPGIQEHKFFRILYRAIRLTSYYHVLKHPPGMEQALVDHHCPAFPPPLVRTNGTRRCSRCNESPMRGPASLQHTFVKYTLPVHDADNDLLLAYRLLPIARFVPLHACSQRWQQLQHSQQQVRAPVALLEQQQQPQQQQQQQVANENQGKPVKFLGPTDSSARSCLKRPCAVQPCSHSVALPCSYSHCLPPARRALLQPARRALLPCPVRAALPCSPRPAALQPVHRPALPLGPRAALPCSSRTALPCPAAPRVVPCCSSAPRVTPSCSPHVAPCCPARRALLQPVRRALLQPARRALLQPARRALLPCTARALLPCPPRALLCSLRRALLCSLRRALLCSLRRALPCPAAPPSPVEPRRPARAALPNPSRAALPRSPAPPSRPAAATTAAAAARATAAAGRGAAGSAAGAGGAGGATGSAGGATAARGGQRWSLPLPDDPTPHQLREWVLQRARPGGGGFGFLRTAQRRQQCQQETFSPQVLSELVPQRCVTGSVKVAALGASESAAALGASESVAALGASESAAALGASESAAALDASDSAATLGAHASPATGPSSAEALHTFTLDSGASRCFFPSTILPCPAVPSGSLSDLHLPMFSTNLGSNAAIQDVWVDTFIPGGQRVAICTCSRTGRHLATFTRRPGSSLYTLTTASAQVAKAGQVAASSQVSASGQLAASCSCRVLSHQTLLWHHRLGHPSLQRLRSMHFRLLIYGLPRSLPSLPRSPAPPCLPCERYFLLVVDDYTRYTTVFPLRCKVLSDATIRIHVSQALYDAVVARYSSPATAALGRLLLPYLFLELSAFATVEDVVSHLRTSDARYCAALPAEFLEKNPPPMDHILALDPTALIVDLLEQHLLATKTSVVAVGAARGTPRTPFFEGCSPSPLAPSYASAAAVDVPGAEDVGAASASAKRRSNKDKGSRGGGGGSGGGGGGSSRGGGGSGGGGSGGSGGGSGGFGGGGGGSGGSGGSGSGGSGGGRTGAQRGGSGGGQRQQQQRRSETASPQQLCDWSGVVIFDLDYDAILAAMYALSVSAEGDYYLCVPPDPGIEALHTFTLESGASRCFFYDSTTLTPLSTPVPVRLADPSGGPVLAHSSTVLPCPAVPSGSLSGLHLPSFSTNLVSTAALQDAMVTTTTPGGQRVSVYTCTQTGHHLAMFTRRHGSSLYTLATEPPQIAACAQVSASGQVAPPCSCRLLSHQTLLWHHRLGHPSLPRLRGMHSRLFVSGLPRSLPPLPPSPARPCLPCIEGRQRAAPHSSSFPSTTAPLQTLHIDVWGPARVSGQGRERYFLLVVDDYTRYTMVFPLRSKGQVVDVLIPWIRAVRLQLRERFRQDLPVLCLHSDRGGEFSSDLLRDFCHGEGILQSFTLPESPQQNGIAECRIGLVMEVARTSMIHAVAPHFLWPFAFYHPTSRRVFPSQDVTFDESVPFYRLFPYRSAPPPPPSLFLAPDPPPVGPLPPQDPLPGTAPVEVAVGLGAAPGAASGGAEPGGAEPEGVEPGGAEPQGVEPGGADSEGVESGGAEPRGTASSGGPAGASTRLSPRPEPLSPQQQRKWFAQRTRLRSGAAIAGDSAARDTGAGGAGVTVRAGGTGGAATAGPGGARTRGTGDAGTGGVGGAGAGDPTEPGAAGAGGARARGTGAGGGGAGGAGAVDPGAGGAGGTVRPRPYFVPLLQQVLGVLSSTGLPPPLLCPPPDQSQPLLQPASPLLAPSPYTEQTGGRTERRERASRHASPARTGRRVPRLHPPPVPGTQTMALRPSSVPLRVPLPAPPASSLPAVPDPESNLAHAASPTVSRLLATVLTDPSFESTAASALVAELVDFAAACRLDYATALVAESASASPPSAGGECALGTDVLEDRQEDFECLAAADPDAPDIPTPRSYAEAITGPYSSQWQAAMDAEMASWKSTGTYDDAVPPSRANIVDGMWIFKVKRPPGSPPAFKARYVARGFSQRQGVNYFQTFSPTPKMTTLRVLLHDAAQRDYELHSLDFSTAFLQGSLHEEIWLRRQPGTSGSSCEAEIYAGAMASQELRWLTYLLTDLGEQPRSPPVLYVDNKAMIALCQEHRLEHRTKHIALRYFLARELQHRGQIRLAYVATRANTADIFTKALPPGDHQRFSTVLGLVPT